MRGRQGMMKTPETKKRKTEEGKRERDGQNACSPKKKSERNIHTFMAQR